jgi:P2-related tail formation protein
MINNRPWDDIKTPQDDLSVRQIKSNNTLPLYWGKDSFGRCVFILELNANGADIFNKNNVPIHGVTLDFRVLTTTGNQGLILVLEKHLDQDLFYSLCETLIHVLSNISDPLVGLSVALSQIKRWKVFMAGKKGKLLNSEEIRGLFSELKFMQRMLEKIESELEVLEAWRGPETSHQDFIFANSAVEVKSLSGRERSVVTISSEDQLESLNCNLYLQILRLIDIPKSKHSLSLNKLVKVIEHSLTESAAIEMFDIKLAKAGYVELRAYDKPEFTVAEERTYKVKTGFPRLVRSVLPQGITRVSYDIKLESICDYSCSEDEIWKL